MGLNDHDRQHVLGLINSIIHAIRAPEGSAASERVNTLQRMAEAMETPSSEGYPDERFIDGALIMGFADLEQVPGTEDLRKCVRAAAWVYFRRHLP